MASESDRDLRRLAKRYRIGFKPPGSTDELPAAHRATFENIQSIGEHRFDNFCANIDIHSNDQPWRRQTKSRAEWLAKRASHLFNQQRNEAGWRFGLENDVLRRFNFEVACPKCRARIWRSEIEAYIKESDAAAANLEERRKNRTACHCAPELRPLDHYEIGINPLFDDRTQEVIVHDALLKSELPKKEPDRVYGLQATRNFQKLLSAPAVGSSLGIQCLSVGETVRTSPFKQGIEPLLFPFLILEAKSEKSINGFGDIQTQTAFPILALLKLQEDLQGKVESIVPEARPLVWFFASRGDAWRVYGCYLTADNPPRYDIVQLWDGCIMDRDGALQLLLIVDYIFDWARDIYRPSILRQLKSLAIGEAYERVSVPSDSDILSLRMNITNWIEPPGSNFDEADFDERSTVQPSAIYERIPKFLLEEEIGLFRSPSLVHSCLTEEDLADICCVLQPASLTAYRATALIHEDASQNTISTYENLGIQEVDITAYGDINASTVADQGIVPWNLMIRLSSNLKDPIGGFLFGRSKRLCDFTIGQDQADRFISNIHFRIYVDENGVLEIEDHSVNGTAVDGVRLQSKKLDHEVNNTHPLKHGSVISIRKPPQDYKFVVRIPQRDAAAEIAYRQNVKAFYRRIAPLARKNNNTRQTGEALPDQARRMGDARTVFKKNNIYRAPFGTA